MQASYCDVPNEVLLGVDRADRDRLQVEPGAQGHHHAHATAFSTWSYETEQPLSLEALRQAAARLPATVYRAKGVVHTLDAPERRVVLQVVGKRVDLELADAWGERAKQTRIVVIGARDGFDENELRTQFEGCVPSA